MSLLFCNPFLGMDPDPTQETHSSRAITTVQAELWKVCSQSRLWRPVPISSSDTARTANEKQFGRSLEVIFSNNINVIRFCAAERYLWGPSFCNKAPAQYNTDGQTGRHPSVLLPQAWSPCWHECSHPLRKAHQYTKCSSSHRYRQASNCNFRHYRLLYVNICNYPLARQNIFPTFLWASMEITLVLMLLLWWHSSTS